MHRTVKMWGNVARRLVLGIRAARLSRNRARSESRWHCTCAPKSALGQCGGVTPADALFARARVIARLSCQNPTASGKLLACRCFARNTIRLFDFNDRPIRIDDRRAGLLISKSDEWRKLHCSFRRMRFGVLYACTRCDMNIYIENADQ